MAYYRGHTVRSRCYARKLNISMALSKVQKDKGLDKKKTAGEKRMQAKLATAIGYSLKTADLIGARLKR